MNVSRPITSDIMTINLDGPTSLDIKLNLNTYINSSHANGWGLGWYPNDNQASMVIKDPAPRETQVVADTVTDWSSFRSTVFFCKVRGADKGYTQTETQPFSRSYAGQDWMFLHGGDLDKEGLSNIFHTQSIFLEPLGRTDSELAFCYILSEMAAGNHRRLYDMDPNQLLLWFQKLDTLGSANIYITDGQSTLVYQGKNSEKLTSYTRIQPPNNQDILRSEFASIALSDPRDSYRTALIFSTTPFSDGEWIQMPPGQMIISRRGAIVWNSLPDRLDTLVNNPNAIAIPQKQSENTPNTTQNEQAQIQQAQEQRQGQTSDNSIIRNIRSVTRTPEGQELAYRFYEVCHTTNYAYATPVEHSTHFFRLQPKDDPIQEIEKSSLFISSPCEKIQFEDVFGNQSVHCTIDEPYTSLTVKITSRLKIFARPFDDHGLSRRQTSIPLLWMPWQRQMMLSYLLPTELPEDQLLALTEYAMSFVERNDYNLLKTIQDLNLSIYRDYKYVSGSTSLKTTAFEVYTTRQGVCQDFANLFICITRLLGIPSRYRMGYIYTGANYTNKIQSEASHAWAEVYLPYVGWRGFDPTNGCTASQDHIRVACGRNYLDATPTSGTIYKGGDKETLKVEVQVKEIQE